MKLIIVGGSHSKPSSIVYKLVDKLKHKADLGYEVYNGVMPKHIKDNNLIIWMPDISNDEPKQYPIKDKGAVLICSKVIHGNRTEVDAISRIFSMKGNAVICIYKTDDLYRFKLIDALGNTWVDTSNIEKLAFGIYEFYEWSEGQIRESMNNIICGSKRPYEEMDHLNDFIRFNTILADKVENSLGSRYFGNFSTRCMKLFPSAKIINNEYLFSPRNTDKRRLTVDDFVLVKYKQNLQKRFYYGERKPSVDAPCQVRIYEKYPDINFMIHGHAFIKEAETTENYFPCGDLREVDEIKELFNKGLRYINLKNHGFLLASTDIEMMEYYKNLDFYHNEFLRETKG